MNILIVNHYAGNPKLGMEYRPYYLAKEWQKKGHTVTIIAASNSHVRSHQPKVNNSIQEEIIDGIKYMWIKTPAYRGNSIGRIFNIFIFVAKLFLNARCFSKLIKPNVVIASSTYPLDIFPAKRIASKVKAKLIFEVHDLWPLSPIELGGYSKYHPFIMIMQWAENYAYKHVDDVISMLPNTKEHMQKHGLDLKKWHYVPNGIIIDEWLNNEELNLQIKNEILELRKKYKVLTAYTGSIGIANALHFLVLAGEKMNNQSIGIVIVGDGPEKEKLKKMVSEKKIENVHLFKSINKKEIPSLLALFDYLYIGLQKQNLFRFGISPNKLIDYMMSEKPIIQGISAGNNIVREAECGIDIEPENPDEIVYAINKLNSLSSEKLSEMGRNGKEYVLKNHDYTILANNFLKMIQ